MVQGGFSTATELRGLALPVIRGPGGYFESKDPYDVAWGDLIRALFTPQGSVPMNRQFGSTLWELLWEPVSTEFEVAELVIRDAATRFTPHLVIRQVNVNPQGNRVQIGVVFSLRSDLQAEEERTALIDRSSVTTLGAA